MNGRSRIRLAAAFLAAASWAASLFGGVPTRREGFPGVYVDRSHEWLFAHEDLAIKMLTPIGFDVVLSDCSLEAAGDLSQHDVVVLAQGSSLSPVSSAEEKLLLSYVKNGGTLLLVANAGTSAQRLARSFGYGFVAGGTKPLFAARPLVAQGCPREIPAQAVRWNLVPAKRAMVLVSDAASRPVAATSQYGKGRVVVWADDGAYWDFCAQRDPQGKVASTPVNQALFRWIAPDRAGGEKGRLSYVEAEILEEFSGLRVRYSKPIAPDAKRLTARIPQVIEVVEKWNGQRLPAEHPYTIHFLSGGGGGWAGPEAAGICVYGGDFSIRVMGHEFTHSIANPLPGIFGEGWAILVGQRAGEALGAAEAAQAEEASILRRLDEVDPKRGRLDLMQSEQGPHNLDYQHKAVWLLCECQKRYGDDFMARVLKRRDQKYGVRKPITLTQMFELFAEVSGDPNIHQWYRSIGLTMPGPKP